jgi:hypothetical protein
MSDHVLVLVIHRLIADCMSVGQVFRELWQGYGELLQGKQASLPAPSIHYRDYTQWQQTSDADWKQKHAAYWDERLAGAPCIRWPSGDRSGDDHSDTFDSLTLAFGETLSADLRHLGRQGKTLPGMVLLAVYVAVVSSWCNQRDFVVPFNLIGRHSEHENIVGCFSHVLYLRMMLKGDETFMDLLKLTAQAFYRATFHQDYGRMALRRPELLEATLFQWLSWHPHEVPGMAAQDRVSRLHCEVEDVQAQDTAALTALPPSAVAVEMSFFETPDGICALAHFRTSVFTPDEMNRFIKQLRAFSERIVRDPSMRVADA